MKKIYLAGFDVFKEDSIEIGEEKKNLCSELGFKGLYPLDSEVNIQNLPKKEGAKIIYRGNIDLIREADIVIANLNPFRGLEPDSGTVFECGYALALGKQVVGYLEDLSALIDKVPSGVTLKDGVVYHLDEQGMVVEDFDLPLNLMLGCSIPLYSNFRECLNSLTK